MSTFAIENLRRQLREKFPAAHVVRAEPSPAIPASKPFTPDAFPAGVISEVVPAGPGAGILLLVAGLLGDPDEAAPHPELVLVDGADAFDPASYPPLACSKLLWVRCSSAQEMIKAADLLVHDGNVPFVLLDATGIARRDLSAIPASSWLRIKQTAGRTGGRVVVLSLSPLVPCASLRLTLSADLSLGDFDVPRPGLLEKLKPVSEAFSRAT
ncbi:MAG TPA: hypothetical protein VF258_06655 [Luteolibacter sp.]